MTLLVCTFASKRVGASGGISMASQPNSEFLIMPAELHSAAVTFGMHFGGSVRKKISVANQAKSKFLAVHAELH